MPVAHAPEPLMVMSLSRTEIPFTAEISDCTSTPSVQEPAATSMFCSMTTSSQLLRLLLLTLMPCPDGVMQRLPARSAWLTGRALDPRWITDPPASCFNESPELAAAHPIHPDRRHTSMCASSVIPGLRWD